MKRTTSPEEASISASHGGSSYRWWLAGSALTVGALAAAFLGLTALVWETNREIGLDQVILRLRGVGLVDAMSAQGGPAWLHERLLPERVVHLGARTVVISIAFLLALLALIWRDRIGAIVAVGAPGLTGAATEYVIKPLVNEPAPVGARAFPSGHAGGIVGVALVALVLVYRRWGRWPALALIPLATLAILAVGGALLRLDLHYPTDVLGGGLLASATVFGLTAVLSLYRGPGHHLLARSARVRRLGVPPGASTRCRPRKVVKSRT